MKWMPEDGKELGFDSITRCNILSRIDSRIEEGNYNQSNLLLLLIIINKMVVMQNFHDMVFFKLFLIFW